MYLNLNYLVWWGDNVARLYSKNVVCGPRAKKVAHPWSSTMSARIQTDLIWSIFKQTSFQQITSFSILEWIWLPELCTSIVLGATKCCLPVTKVVVIRSNIKYTGRKKRVFRLSIDGASIAARQLDLVEGSVVTSTLRRLELKLKPKRYISLK